MKTLPHVFTLQLQMKRLDFQQFRRPLCSIKTQKGGIMRKMKRKKGMIFVEEASSCLLEFHQQFVEELNQHGIDEAAPKKILELMINPDFTIFVSGSTRLQYAIGRFITVVDNPPSHKRQKTRRKKGSPTIGVNQTLLKIL
ncbi:uncharacterized protein LOC118480509 isoform X3 [Helianthus annuus]|uniref:uncharacterized protein LOC118480509 isoform X3 n=1 Tax=Helianthus annuus TaxID=4232 RepID=UPI001652F337|nr:uncharacterized protein LOC118480509 isoform X3 [Helianthus annuus]XP_035831318.1 uncharacterized protein LOC118480509 isoform X3 [Helianthus annuus]XP_035831319.1 uncharacterized protein LOC118480509 isoform X3 [Helianthus annuus]